MLNREKLEELATQAGADVFGVADIGRFAGLPAEKHPAAIFPETRSVIVLGRRINRGALRGVEEGTNFTNFRLYGYEWLDNRFTSLTTFKVAEFIEDNGWEAVPLPNLPPEIPPMGVSVCSGRTPPNVLLDFDDAAVRAGIGEIGYCGILLTPRLGPRQRVQVILTDAEIEPSPIVSDEICPRSETCRGFCPLGAIKGERRLEICGKEMLVADIDYSKCRACKNGAHPNRYHPSGKPDRVAAFCIRSCMDFLEKTERIGNRFHTPFRTRDSWQLPEEVDFYKA